MLERVDAARRAADEEKRQAFVTIEGARQEALDFASAQKNQREVQSKFVSEIDRALHCIAHQDFSFRIDAGDIRKSLWPSYMRLKAYPRDSRA